MIIVISVAEEGKATVWLDFEYKTKEQIQEEFIKEGIFEKVIFVKEYPENKIIPFISALVIYDDFLDDFEKFLSDIFEMGVEYGEKLPKFSL